MSIQTGSRLGPYQITGAIGAGGMGEVFRARDTKLNRDVAIKVLPAAFVHDHERVARFKREAQVLASLNHPNIAAIHGLEEGDGAVALVLELVEGEDLSQRLQRGAIPLDEVIVIARQIAEALEEAHEHGIIHRDLKPANIKVTPDGKVKVLDFGLAKAFETEASTSSASSQLSHSPTMSRHMTEAGMIMGTAAYMSPEQARGKRVDRRADIWAFGVVVYEMLGGHRAFDGETITDVIAAVVTREPDWTALPASTPARLKALLLRCLKKDPKARLRDIGEARLQLEELISGASGNTAETAATSSSPSVSGPRHRRLTAVAVTAVVTAIAALGFAAWLNTRPTPPLTPVTFTLDPPEGERFATSAAFVSISPDGQRIAFETGSEPGLKLWLRPLGLTQATQVSGVTNAWQVAWAPDGQSIVFTDPSQSGPFGRIDLGGGPLLTLSVRARPLRPAWNPFGIILYTGDDGRLYRVSANGGESTAVTTLDQTRQENQHAWPSFLPDGRRFVYSARSIDAARSALYLASLDSPERTHLVDVLSMVDAVPGFLVYHRNGVLLAHPFDEKSERLKGEPIPIAQGVQYNPAHGRASFAVSQTGVIAYRISGSSESNASLKWFDRKGNAVRTVVREGLAGRGELSPDGRRALVYSAADGSYDLFMNDLERGVSTRFTTDRAADRDPVWSPDGTTVVFRSNRKAYSDLYRAASGGATRDEPLLESAQDKTPSGFSPDGKLLLYTVFSTDAASLWALPTTGDTKPFRVFPSATERMFDAVFSPDGRWIAYTDWDAKHIFVQAFPQNGAKTQISTTAGTDPHWTKGGREIVYVTRDSHYVAVPVTPEGGTMRAGQPEDLFKRYQTGALTDAFMVDSTGERFLLSVEADGVSSRPAPLTVVVNWPAALVRR